MSAFQQTGVRCDWCGKFARNERGEYTRPICNEHGVPLAGYIRRPPWEVDEHGNDKSPDDGFDICEECRIGLCPQCGENEIVRVTPATPGPDGWGGRCKACGFEWTIPTIERAGAA
jgi:hypothetical protein